MGVGSECWGDYDYSARAEARAHQAEARAHWAEAPAFLLAFSFVSVSFLPQN